jgi:AAA+ ATPase superfamily predicted ATPase
VFNEPVAGEKFFGREEVLELLVKRASALKDGYRQNVALTGQSLSGKSSIILHFLQMIRDEGFVPIYVEVVKEPFKLFANKFMATMLYNSLVKMGEDPGLEMGGIMERSRERLPKTCANIKSINMLIERGDLEDAYLSLLGLTSTLKSEVGLSCIVMLDEFDNLESLGIKNPFLGFGKVIMVQKDTMYIVSSSRNEAIKKIISEKLSLLFGNFEVVNVSNFGLKTAGEFVNIKLAGFDIDSKIKKFMIAFTDGNPFYLDKICSRAKTLALERMKSYVDKDDVVGAMLEYIYDSGGSIHQYLLNYILELLDTKNRESMIAILSAIADGNNKKSDIARSIRSRQSDIAKDLVRLSELGLISKNGVFYAIGDSMLGFWLKNVYQRRKALLVDGTINRMDIFRKEAEQYVSGFITELGKTATQRVADLFNMFNNELVSVDSKNIKLPHFTKIDIRPSVSSGDLVTASFRGNYWAVKVYEDSVSENDIVNFIRGVKTMDVKIANRIIVPLCGMDENAKLLAKELKISIWERHSLNALLRAYGKSGVFTL